MADKWKEAEIKLKQALFKEEVKKGLHPEWVINPAGELEFVGELSYPTIDELTEDYLPQEDDY